MAQNPTPSQLDPGQIIKRAFDEANDRVRVDAEVTATIGEAEVVISHVDDSIRLGNGTDLVTTTTVGADVGLDVNIVGGVVSGTFSSSGLQLGIETTAVTVTDVPTKIPGTPLNNRNGISVRVWGAQIVYFGKSTVTTSNGYPKRQFEEITLDVKDNASVELYGICDAGQSCEVRVIELA